MKFKEGDLVYDSAGRVCVIVASFKSLVGIFYNVLLDGNIMSLAEEELTKKD